MQPRVTQALFGGGSSTRVVVEHRKKKVGELDRIVVRPLVARRQQVDERSWTQFEVLAKVSLTNTHTHNFLTCAWGTEEAGKERRGWGGTGKQSGE